MEKRDWIERAAIGTVPNPAEFPLGSPESRAAARAMLNAREAVAESAEGEEPLTLVVLPAGCEVSPEGQKLIEETVAYAKTHGHPTAAVNLLDCGHQPKRAVSG